MMKEELGVQDMNLLMTFTYYKIPVFVVKDSKSVRTPGNEQEIKYSKHQSNWLITESGKIEGLKSLLSLAFSIDQKCLVHTILGKWILP